jgi:hypothetical protein
MLTPYQSYRKVEEVFFDECSQLKTTIEKNRKKRKIFQNKCVSSQNMQYEKRRGRYRSGVTYLPSAGSFVRRAVGQ